MPNRTMRFTHVDVPAHVADVNVRTFITAYIEAMLWTEAETANGLDASDLTPNAITRIVVDCLYFLYRMAPFLTDDAFTGRIGYGSSVAAQAAHDLWLTRNRHGAGFWDGDWNEPQASMFTKCAHAMGEVHLYRTDDDKLTLS